MDLKAILWTLETSKYIGDGSLCIKSVCVLLGKDEDEALEVDVIIMVGCLPYPLS